MTAWTIYADLRITRRKLFHVVQNPKGETVYRSRLLGACLEFCEAEGAEEIVLTYVVEARDKEPGSYHVARITN